MGQDDPGRATSRLPPPDLEWPAGGPRATAFGDIYYDAEDPVGEVRHVFLDGCGLPDAWCGRDRFTVAETGFGTGLNILLLIALWQRTREQRPDGARLSIYSVEGHPMTAAALAQAHAALPAEATAPTASLANQLRAHWPPPYPGTHRIAFPGASAELILLFDTVESALATADFAADAWFLDGFAPARNPAMWTPAVLEEVARLSAPAARAASFTAAGAVRRGLEAAGFAVTKRPGFARKRNCLTATLERSSGIRPAPVRSAWAHPIPRAVPDASIAVVGGGPAALWTARALADRGLAPRLVAERTDAHPPAALIAPKLVRGDTAFARLSALAYIDAVRRLDALAVEAPNLWLSRGLREPAPDDGARGRQAMLAAALDWPLDWLRETDEGLDHPRGGVIDPAVLTAALSAPLSPLIYAHVTRIEPTANGWILRDRSESPILAAAQVVIAAGPASAGLLPDAETASPLRYAGGRLFLVPPGQDLPGTAQIYGGFLTPALGPPEEARALLGATARPAPDPAAARAAESGTEADGLAECLARLRTVDPARADALQARIGDATPDSWVGVRTTTPDHLPLMGPVPESTVFRATYRRLARGDRHAPSPSSAPMHAGLTVLTGLGARGHQMAPLLGDVLAARLTDGVGLLPTPLEAALHPARFLFRAIARGDAEGDASAGPDA